MILEDDVGGIDSNLLKEWVALHKEKNELAARTKEVKRQMEEKQERLLQQLADAGVPQIRCDGITVWVDRKLWASATDHEALSDAFVHTLDMGEFVKTSVHGGQLSSWVREFDPDGVLSPDEVLERLPEEVRALIKISEVVQLQGRAS